MQHKFDRVLTETANKVSKIPLFKTILKPLYYPFKNYRKEQQAKYFRKHALNVISQFHDCLTDAGVDYTLAYGTLLGAVREHGFINYDIDIDVIVWEEQRTDALYEALRLAGFTKLHMMLLRDGKLGREEAFVKDGVSIDVFYAFDDKEGPYWVEFKMPEGSASFNSAMKDFGYMVPVKVRLPLSKARMLVPFESVHLYIPANADELLKQYYGDNYMTPIKNWIGSIHRPWRNVWDGERAIYTDCYKS